MDERVINNKQLLMNIAACGLEVSTNTVRMKAARWKLGKVFPDTREAALWIEVILQCVEDASSFVYGKINSFHVAEAHSYLRQKDIYACDVCGVESDYVRRVLSQAGLLLR